MQKEWPSAEKIRELRENGVFAYSKLASRSIVSIAVLLVTFFLLSDFRQMFEVIGKMLKEPHTNFAAVKFYAPQLLYKLKDIFLIYAVTVVCSLSVAILIQSHFYFSATKLTFNISQIIRAENLSVLHILILVCKSFFGLILGAFFSCLLFYYSFSEFLALAFSDYFLYQDKIDLSAYLKLTQSLVVGAFSVLFVTAIIAYFAAKLGFLIKHRTVKYN